MRNLLLVLCVGLFVNALPVNAQNGSFGRVSDRLKISRHLESLYRKPSKKESQLLQPDATDETKYADFLKTPNTGLIKLMPDLGCSENPKILVATDICNEFTMPGGGSAFSFRKGYHRIWRLADLLYKSDIFHAVGTRSQGIMVALGDVPLDKVSLNTRGIEFLRNFVPATEFNEAKKQNNELIEGIAEGDFYYRKALRAVENTTYVLRSVAYRGSFFRSYEGVIYDELSFDDRSDVIVAFRIVRKNESDGSVTLLWKELANAKSPKLKVSKDDKLKTL